MRRFLGTYLDLMLCIGLALATPFALEVDMPLLRIPLGLLMVLFVPGYVLVATIFARSAGQDGPMVVTMSLMLSITILPILGLLLDLLPGGISPANIALALSNWTVLFGLLAMIRRVLLPPAEVHATPVVNPYSMLRSLRPAQRIVGLLLLLLVGGLLVGTVLVVRQPDPTAQLTEFYVLGRQGFAEAYPYEARPGEPIEVTVGIANFEPATQQYRIEVSSAQKRLAQLGPIEIASGQRWESPLRYTLSTSGPDQQIELALYRQNDVEPYRRLLLWVDVLP